jgi:hypothetical protein
MPSLNLHSDIFERTCRGKIRTYAKNLGEGHILPDKSLIRRWWAIEDLNL